MSGECRRKLLGELLKEEQEPFELEAFLREKRAQVLGSQRKATTTLGQLLLQRGPLIRAAVGGGATLRGRGFCDASVSSSSSSSSSCSSLVSKPKSSRSNPCTPPPSTPMATLTRHHPLFNTSSSWRLMSPLPEPAKRTALSLLLEAAAGRVHGKLSQRRKNKNTKKKPKQYCKELKQRRRRSSSRKKPGGNQKLRMTRGFLGSLLSSLVKRKRFHHRMEIADGHHDQLAPAAAAASMGDILNWKWSPDKVPGRSSRRPRHGVREPTKDIHVTAERGAVGKGVGLRHWKEQRPTGAAAAAAAAAAGGGASVSGASNADANAKEALALDERCHRARVLDRDFVCSWGYANNSASSCICSSSSSSSGSEACSSSSTATGTTRSSRHPSGSSVSSSSLSLSPSCCDNHRGADNLDGTESPCSSPTSPRRQQQVSKQEEEVGVVVEEGGGEDGHVGSRVVGNGSTGDDDEEDVVDEDEGTAGRSSNNNNGVCGDGVLAEAEKDQLSPVSVLEPPPPFDVEVDEEEEEEEEDHNRQGGRGEKQEAADAATGAHDNEDVEEEEEDHEDDEADDYGDEEDPLHEDGLHQFQRSLTIILESRKQILKKLSRFESLAAGVVVEPVNLDDTFAAAASRQRQDEDEDGCCCSSSCNQGVDVVVLDSCGGLHDDQLYRDDQRTHRLRRPGSSSTAEDADDDATPSLCSSRNSSMGCDAIAEAAAGSRFAINNKFLVRACWEEANVRSSTTIEMMVEEDLCREGRALAAEWRGAGQDQASEVAVGIEASIFAFLVDEFYHDLW